MATLIFHSTGGKNGVLIKLLERVRFADNSSTWMITKGRFQTSTQQLDDLWKFNVINIKMSGILFSSLI